MDQIEKVDICCGLSWGDEGKGKVVSQLSKSKYYDFVCRWNGGNNAGHTIYVNNIKYKTHLIPSGVFFNIKSIIGPDCVVNVKSFFEELQYLEMNDFDTNLIKISPYANIVTEEHIEEDISKLVKSQGSTAKGIAPCYGAKYKRNGIQAKDIDILNPYMWDHKLHGNILCEGAQGFWLDINYGNYPFTTSSTTLPYGACSLGIPPQYINKIIGAIKIYDTRSGIDPDFPESLLDDPELAEIGKLGEEYGTTTGRKRIVNWLNMDKLVTAINLSGTTDLIISKVDILYKLKLFKIIILDTLQSFNSISDMISFINDVLRSKCILLKEIIYSDNPHDIKDNTSQYLQSI
jgi:adenylosuccinate synthase